MSSRGVRGLTEGTVGIGTLEASGAGTHSTTAVDGKLVGLQERKRSKKALEAGIAGSFQINQLDTLAVETRSRDSRKGKPASTHAQQVQDPIAMNLNGLVEPFGRDRGRRKVGLQRLHGDSLVVEADDAEM